MTPKNKKARDKILRWKADPVAFVKEAIGANPSSQQIEGLLAYNNHKRISIRSGHGTGKDAYASWCIQHFLVTRYYPKILCTAPTAHQLRDVLWSEINKWLRQSLFKEEFVWNSSRIFQKNSREEWFATYATARPNSNPEEQAETLAGFHADSLLIIVDEASGLADPVYLPLEGALTQPDNKAILIGNMTRRSGYFFNTHFDEQDSKHWHTLHWDAEQSELVTREQIEFYERKYGRDSDIFRIRVSGEPPSAEEAHSAVVPMAWANQCVGNEFKPDPEAARYISVDVARFGDDRSVVMPRQGMVIYPWRTIKGMDTQELGEEVRVTYTVEQAAGIGVDEIGVGAGVVDYLTKRLGHEVVHGVNVAKRAPEKEKFALLRDQLWWQIRENCRKAAYYFPPGKEGRDLVDELCLPCYKVQGSKIKVESKDEIKKKAIQRGLDITSPDIAEALLISEFFYVDADTLWKYTTERQQRSSYSITTPNAWMAV